MNPDTRVVAWKAEDKDHLRTLVLNARSANVLNHHNVTAVQAVLLRKTSCLVVLLRYCPAYAVCFALLADPVDVPESGG